MPLFGLIDCNNFYVSCERVFNPKIENKPVVILSNNDGCIIARSNEAKKLNIPMGAPYFQWKSFLNKNNVFVYSSNYALYGDMSHRVMSIIQEFCRNIEIYSIDEAFLEFNNINSNDLYLYSINIIKIIKQNTGIPTSIGIAKTKTLAKIANYIAKKQRQTGVFNLCDPKIINNALASLPVNKTWGIGQKHSAKLKEHGIYTAIHLRDANQKIIRSKFSVVVEKIIQELNGISCLPLESIQPKKQIMSSRSFGHELQDIENIAEAVSHYTSTACLKLRKQNSMANGISVFIHTNLFNPENLKYSNNISYKFPTPSNDTSYIIHIAKFCLNKIFKKKYKYKKAGIILFDIVPKDLIQQDLFINNDNSKKINLLKTIDNINEKLGKNTVFYCAEGIKKKRQSKEQNKSPSYTTKWEDIPNIK
ncbi:Y-family DNA polymerase [Gammaproteobacteria bacterium]|nr:Y-family DNA polymerase [Gammaproteobacteria bacterium]